MASDWGADVGKDAVVVSRHGTSSVLEVGNDERSLRAWVKGLEAGSRIGVEASGVYHRCLARVATAAGHTVYVLNPRDVRHYAKGVGRRAKTDRVDAQVIARYVAHEHEHLRAYSVPTPGQEAIAALLEKRHAVVKAKVSLGQSLGELPGYRKVRGEMEKLLREIDGQLERLVREQSGLQALCTRLRSIPGVGPLLGAGLANVLMQHGFHSGDALIAYLGYDPRADDSGRRHGRRRLSKRGPAEMRRLLYTAAMAAARTRAWKPFYERDRARGLSATEAIIVLARRLARTAFSLARHATTFDPARLAGACPKP
jgi:transposase